tara:strand:- start:4610 stop:5230 length:621 start_codon:yes stop_codon:yes gene_type:complete
MRKVLDDAVQRAKKPIVNIEVKCLSAQNFALYPTANFQDWLEAAASHGFERHLLIARRNGLRRLLSHLMAQRSGVYVKQQYDESLPLAERQITIDVNAIQEGLETHSLLDWLELYEQTHWQLRDDLKQWCMERQQPPPLELIYEEVIEPSPQLAYSKVCNALGLATEPVHVRFRRINPEPLVQLIRNWQEIETLLTPTRFSWMLDS